MSTPRIGFIGIGMMGHGMAKNMLAKGYSLTLKVNRDRSRLDDLLAAGAREAKTNADAARGADIVIICVTGSSQVEDIVFGADGLLSAAREGSLLMRLWRERPRKPRKAVSTRWWARMKRRSRRYARCWRHFAKIFFTLVHLGKDMC
jgi:3-hydroxyisobutyrate dehydrogenase-like beta-hydroxyacid dehydrogenase